MKLKTICTIAALSLIAPLQANAFVFINDAQIDTLIQFEGGLGRDFTLLNFSNSEARCRISHDDKELYTFALSLYMAKKTVDVVCHDALEDPGGSTYKSHKLHRLIAK